MWIDGKLAAYLRRRSPRSPSRAIDAVRFPSALRLIRRYEIDPDPSCFIPASLEIATLKHREVSWPGLALLSSSCPSSNFGQSIVALGATSTVKLTCVQSGLRGDEGENGDVGDLGGLVTPQS